MSGDNSGCHKRRQQADIQWQWGLGILEDIPQSSGQTPLQSTVGCHTDSEDSTSPAGGGSCSAGHRGPERWEETQRLSQQNVPLLGTPLLGTAFTGCSAIRNTKPASFLGERRGPSPLKPHTPESPECSCSRSSAPAAGRQDTAGPRGFSSCLCRVFHKACPRLTFFLVLEKVWFG